MSVFRNLLMVSSPPAPSRRHIQVGDNLYNKPIYFEFPSDFNLLSKAYHQSFGDTGIKYRIFIATDSNIVNPKTFGSFGYDIYPVFATYFTSNIPNNCMVTVFRADRTYKRMYSNISSSPVNLTSGEVLPEDYNIDKTITFVDTSNPAYEHIWIDNE